MSSKKSYFELLETAVLAGNLAEVERLTSSKCTEEKIPYSILKKAVVAGQTETAKLIIQRECLLREDPKKYDDNEILHLAILKGNIEVVKSLLQHEVNVKKVDNDGIPPLFQVVHLSDKYNLPEFLNCLIQKGGLNTKHLKRGFTILHYAVELGNENIIKLLIEKKCHLNTVSSDGSTALHVAAKLGRSNIVEILLKSGANSNILIGKKTSALHLAIKSGDLKTFEMLLDFVPLKKQAQTINKMIIRRQILKKSENEIAVYLAACASSIDILKILLSNGAKVNSQSSVTGSSALHVAVEKTNLEIVNLLLKHKANLKTVDKNGLTPLHKACVKGNVPIVCRLLETDEFNLNAETNSGLTPLHLALENGHSEVLSLLLEREACYKEFEQNNAALLCLALENIQKDSDMLTVLMKKSVNRIKCNGRKDKTLGPVIQLIKTYSTTRSETENSILHIAVENEDETAVDLLLKHQVCINAVNKNNQTPFELATINGFYSIVHVFLQNTDKVESLFVAKKNRLTPFHIAVKKGYKSILELFLKFGISPNLPQLDSLTPLHIAVEKNDEDLVSLLLRKGAKVDVQGKTELETPLFIAAEKGNANILKMLSEASLVQSSEWKGGYLLLCIAAYRGHERIVEMLLEKGINLNANLDKYLTPLHAAAQQGHENIVRLLLKHGAMVNPKRASGTRFISTPLLAASYGKHSEIVRLLLNHGAYFNAKLEGFYIKATNKNQKDIAVPVLPPEQSASTKVNFEKILTQGNYKETDVRGEGTVIRYTCLHFAVEAGDEEIVKLLINLGAVVNFETNTGLTAIGLAIEREDEEIIKHLLFAGADVSRYHRGVSILKIKSLKKNVKIAETIIKCLCSSRPFSSDVDFTPLGFAVEYGLDACVEKFLKDGADLNMEHKEEPLLHVAVNSRNTAILEILLKQGININIKNKDGQTALKVACLLGLSDIVELLLDKILSRKRMRSINPDIAESLFASITAKKATIVDIFLKRDLADCTLKNVSPLCAALQNSSPEVVQKFLNYRDSINNFDVEDKLFLVYAMKKKNFEVVQFLLKKGVFLEANKNGGYLLLHTALKYKCLDEKMFQLLADYGVNVDEINKKGERPLGIILQMRSDEDWMKTYTIPKLLKLFLLNGANPNQWHHFGQTLLDLSIDREDSKCVKLLLTNGANVNISDGCGEYPLEHAYDKLVMRSAETLNEIDNFDFDDWESTSKEIDSIRMLKITYLITQEVMRQLAVHGTAETNKEILNSKYIQKYQRMCEREIHLMASTNICRRITYFDILSANKNELASLARNNEVRFILLPESNVTKLFPIYAEMLIARIQIGRDRRHLLDTSYHLLNKALRFNFPPLVVDHVFSFISDKDLRNLNYAFKNAS